MGPVLYCGMYCYTSGMILVKSDTLSVQDVGVVNRLLSNNTRMNTPETVALATGIAENNVAAALGNTSVSTTC